MPRNLLPRLRSAANIKVAQEGAWTIIPSPAELARLEYAADDAGELRTRIQSIPSPWARLLLFRAALGDPDHPARVLVENEILDALELLWSSESLKGVTLDFRRVPMADLPRLAAQSGSERVEGLSDALVRLAPRRPTGEPAMASLVVAVLNQQRPVVGSSPYTLVFTSEDAANPGSPRLFRYAQGEKRRELVERSFGFQAYVARVLLPQLAALPPGPDVEATTVQTLLLPWLRGQVARCEAAAGTRAAQVAEPDPNQPWDWHAAAADLGLQPIEQPFAGVTLFRRVRGRELEESPWQLVSSKVTRQRPLVIDPGLFDGVYFDGAAPVPLPDSLRGLDREVLPGLGMSHPWVSPAVDWLTDQLLLLNEPLQQENVHGLRGYRWHGPADDPRFGLPRLALPLRREFFRYFTAEELDDMLSIEVLPGGRIEVTLRLKVGNPSSPRALTIRRAYTDADVRREPGPALALWPSFRHPDWTDYVVFRADSSTQLARFYRVDPVLDGQTLANEVVSRLPLLHIATADRAPEALEILNTMSGEGAQALSLGVVVPRYRPTPGVTQTSWQVGVDFGTSNTVLSLRENDETAGEVFAISGLTLALTEPAPGTQQLMEAYYFPFTVERRPFGTAVVHLKALPTLHLEQEPLGGRVNVPFSGYVREYESNAIAGELKWSDAPHAYFLSASFLRHLVAAVLANAIQNGVSPARVTFTWAYPRSFLPSQVSQLESMWDNIVRLFSKLGVRPDAAQERTDESRSVLRYFFNTAVVSPAGDEKVILDVGGGTTDIAVYGRGRVLLLDSVILGGRNLAGPRRNAATREAQTNPFVEAFVNWANKEGNLPAQDADALRAYLADRQIHLAFNYLVTTRWFQEGKAALFAARREFHDFQALIFYLFSALFYYAGLTFRGMAERDGNAADGGAAAGGDGGVRLPRSVVVAGNGSRFLGWLTDLKTPRENPFHRALAGVLAAGAGVKADAPRPGVVPSENPKLEVALGLIAKVDPAGLNEAGAVTTPVVGEAVQLRTGDEGTARTYSPAACYGAGERIKPAYVREARWEDGELEVQRFHRAVIDAAREVAGHGRQWSELPDRYRRVFAEVEPEIRDLAKSRLEYLVQHDGEFAGSIFVLECSVVLDRLLDAFFSKRA
ncbi:MAG TPA: hypothetical protein VF092_17140 [Longimicrobium sp.]